MLDTRTKRLDLLATVAIMAVAVFVLTSAPSVASEQNPVPKGDDYKCYPVLDWTEFEPQRVTLQDQFGKSEARTLRPHSLCNPVGTNGESIADENNHLVCYQVNDDPVGSFERVREVEVENQFGTTHLWLGVPSKLLCVPSSKRLIR